MHGSSVHSGKIPHRTGGRLETKHEIAVLRAAPKEAVAKEAYEQASEYRDQTRALEHKLAHQEGAEAQEGEERHASE